MLHRHLRRQRETAEAGAQLVERRKVERTEQNLLHLQGTPKMMMDHLAPPHHGRVAELKKMVAVLEVKTTGGAASVGNSGRTRAVKTMLGVAVHLQHRGVATRAAVLVGSSQHLLSVLVASILD